MPKRVKPQRVKTSTTYRYIRASVTPSIGAVRLLPDSILNQLGVPVGAIDLRQIWHPFAVAPEAEHFRRKRRPLGPPRPAEQMHPSLVGRAATLTAIAVMA